VSPACFTVFLLFMKPCVGVVFGQVAINCAEKMNSFCRCAWHNHMCSTIPQGHLLSNVGSRLASCALVGSHPCDSLVTNTRAFVSSE
jgi:hypothetical protein